VELFRKGTHATDDTSISENRTASKERSFESIVANLEKIFTSQFELLRNDIRVLERRISEMESASQTTDMGDEFVQRIVSAVVNEVSQLATRSSSQNKSIDELKKNPLNLNSATEAELRLVSGIGPQKASEIIGMRHAKGSFTNVDELAEVRGISKNTISRYQWHECFVV